MKKKYNPLRIRAPRWKERTIGIDEKAFSISGDTYVEIMYANKAGERIYPHIYAITRKESARYPVQQLAGGAVRLRLIPIQDLRIKVERDAHCNVIRERPY